MNKAKILKNFAFCKVFFTKCLAEKITPYFGAVYLQIIFVIFYNKYSFKTVYCKKIKLYFCGSNMGKIQKTPPVIGPFFGEFWTVCLCKILSFFIQLTNTLRISFDNPNLSLSFAKKLDVFRDTHDRKMPGKRHQPW